MGFKVNLPWRTAFPAQRRVRAKASQVLDEDEGTILVDQVNHFDDEIRTALRSTGTAVTVGLIVLTLGVSVTKDVSRDVALFVLFPLLALVASIHAQAAADVAVMAEVRDRLAVIVNRRADYPLLNVRLISDIRRFAMGTVGVNIVLGVAIVGATIAIASYAWGRSHDAQNPVIGGPAYFWVLLMLMVLSIIAVGLAIFDIDRGRQAIYMHLDDVFGCDTRPDHLVLEEHIGCSDKPTPKLDTCPYSDATQP